MLTMLFLSLADFKTIEVSSRSVPTEIPTDAILLVMLAIVLLVAFRATRGSRRRPRGTGRKRQRRARRTHQLAPFDPKSVILVDGSNVMHWQDEKPLLAPLVQVVRSLQLQGYQPGVVFDANAGHKLAGRFLNEGDFATMLSLPRSQVLVVPKGTQADPYLLETAKDFGARIVTNDRYRDWAEAYPKVLERGFLIRGEMRGGKVRLNGLEIASATAGAQS